MAKLSQKMYFIGRIVNVVEIAAALILLIIGIVFYCIPDTIAASSSSYTVKSASELGFSLLIAGAVSFVVVFAIYVIAIKALSTFGDGKTNIAPHIVMIIVGALGIDCFYLLGGLLGINAEYSEDER